MTKLSKIIFISAASVTGATIVVVPTAIALTEKKVEVVRKVKLDTFEVNKIISDPIKITAKDHFLDFEIDLSLLKTHGVFAPYKFLIAENTQYQHLIVSDLKKVKLNGKNIDHACYEFNYNGIIFTRPIFNISIDTKLTGRLTIANSERQVGLYRFTWMWR